MHRRAKSRDRYSLANKRMRNLGVFEVHAAFYDFALQSVGRGVYSPVKSAIQKSLEKSIDLQFDRKIGGCVRTLPTVQ